MSPEVREAATADDPALCDLAVACPMTGALSYCLEREPSFFGLTRLQGEEPRVGVIDGARAGTIDAMATCVPVVRRVGGSLRKLLYLADLKVHPRARGRGLATKLMQRAALEMARDQAPAFGIVLSDNRAMQPLVRGGEGVLSFRPMARLRNYNVFIGGAHTQDGGLVVRRARRSDADELANLWNRVQAPRDLSPVWDGPGLARQLDRMPGLAFECVWVAEREGRPVGFAAAWDACSIKQLRLVSLSRGLGCLRPMYNAVARLKGRPRMPRDGELVPFLYLTNFCAETAADFRALLRRIHDEFIGSPYLYFDLALSDDDPLAPALEGFRTTSLAFDLHWITARALGAPDARRAPAYFDMAFV